MNELYKIFQPQGSIKLLYRGVHEIATIPLSLVTSVIMKQKPMCEQDKEFRILTDFQSDFDRPGYNIDREKCLHYIFDSISFEDIEDFLNIGLDRKNIIAKFWKYKTTHISYTLDLLSDKPPQSLFNYSQLDEIWLKQIVLDNKIYASNPLDFNDPFDCKNYAGNLSEIGKIGVISFSTENDNILLYSHYAKKHSGICYIYDSALLASSMRQGGSLINPQIQKVRYYKRWPNFDIDNEYALYLTSKNSVWSYENEYRLFCLTNDNKLLSSGHYKFDPSALKGIILGCENNHKDMIIDIIKSSSFYNSIALYESTKIENSFRIQISQISI